MIRWISAVLAFAAMTGCSRWEFCEARDPSKLQTTKCAGLADRPSNQQSPEGCWAACAEMAFRYNGMPEQTQEVIAARINKVPTEDENKIPFTEEERRERVRSACELEIMFALYPEFGVRPEEASAAAMKYLTYRNYSIQSAGIYVADELRKWGESKVRKADALADGMLAANAAQQIKRPQPVLVGLIEGADPAFGHVYLLWGMDFVPGSSTWFGRTVDGTIAADALPTIDQGSISKLYLIDPRGGILVEKSAGEIQDQIDFILSRDIAKERLDGIKNSLLLNK